MKEYKEFLNDSNPQVEMQIKDYGTITLELFPEVAPITVENFLNLVSNSFYNGIIFQGGDPLGTGVGGSKDKIKGEFESNGVNNPLKHSRGVISMARTYMPNSASSQFFIMHKDAPHLDGDYAAFGVVINGIEVVDKIATTKTDYQDRPLNKVIIEEVKRVR